MPLASIKHWFSGAIVDKPEIMAVTFNDYFTSIVLYCIVYSYLYSASHGVSQTEALSVHLSSRKKVRLQARERETRKGGRENKRAKRKREVIPEWRTNREKCPSVGHGCPTTRHEKIMALGRAETLLAGISRSDHFFRPSFWNPAAQFLNCGLDYSSRDYFVYSLYSQHPLFSSWLR